MLKIIRWYFLHKAREVRRTYFFYRDYPKESYGAYGAELAFRFGNLYRELARAMRT
jgi:hypothetical protein